MKSTSSRFPVIILILVSIALLIPGITGPMLTMQGTIEKAALLETGTDMLVESIVAGKGEISSEEVEAATTRARGTVNMAMGMLGLKTPEGEIEAYSKTRSILGTVQQLFSDGDWFVGFLVMLFSVIVPVMKMTLLLVGDKAAAVGRAVSKWAMADVFVVAIFVAYLAGNASEDVGGLLNLKASLEWGFYCFLGYCLFSVASAQLTARRP